MEIPEDDPEFEALSDLYNRLFESRDEACCPAVDVAGTAVGRDAEPSHCECLLTQSRPDAAAPTPPGAPDYCYEGAPECNSPMKRTDRMLTAALLRHRKDNVGGGGAAAEGDVKHLTDKLPPFKSCKTRKPGAINSALFGLDLEHWMTSVTGGDGRDDAVKRAAYDLAAAEAHCKHAGAVEAAERAVKVEPAGHLAEVAARFAAQTYSGETGDKGASDGTCGEAGDSSPVVVVAYVGYTGTSPSDE